MFRETEKYFDVTGSQKTFGELSVLLDVSKFGILDAEEDWSYLEKDGDIFGWSNGQVGVGVNEDFPDQANVKVCDVKSKTIVCKTGEVKFSEVILVLAYKE